MGSDNESCPARFTRYETLHSSSKENNKSSRSSPGTLSSSVIQVAENAVRITESIADITQVACPRYATVGVAHQPQTHEVQLINGVSWNVRYQKAEDICANEMCRKMERLGTERLQQHYNVAVLPHEFRNAETSAHSIAVEFDVDQRADIGADVQEDKYENGGRGVLTEAESLESFLQQDLRSYVSLRDIQGISDNDFYIDTIYSHYVVQGTFGRPKKLETDAVEQLNNDSITSSDSSSPSFSSFTASPHIARTPTQRRSSSSHPPPPKLLHFSPSTVQGNSSPRSSFSIQPTPEPASPAPQSSNQDCLLPLQTPVTRESLPPSDSISISAVRPPTKPGNSSGRSTLLAGPQDRSFQYKCNHCPKNFPRACDLNTQTLTAGHISVANHLARKASPIPKIYAVTPKTNTRIMQSLNVPIQAAQRRSPASITGIDIL
ncbi:hypothetical protein sscle_02g011760 [Sclerotinia sclerotiorum 1980 UF-70]|uniref:Uncharacterized protein n=1 Tax=Sclerotinia sclerotiorum (strain ATCC 18683 / 1980 / Ss-1) TaxID=665079 RepID=A0A1D9PUR5_SCLS1|nr:hypothetical protein sscle_02g011760 [Sclerotinia sclerotiorum 1980 UF-70]